MDRVDAIQRSAFLGREFLVWAWFKSELFEGRFVLPKGGEITLWLEAQLTLEGAHEASEQSNLKGAAPSTTPEAREALKQGKLPKSGRLCVERDGLQYSFAFDADRFGLSSVKLPALVKEQTDERFYERMYLLEELEALLGVLFEEFLAVRLSDDWDAVLAPAMRAWVADVPELDTDSYEAVLARARQALRPIPSPAAPPPLPVPAAAPPAE